MANLGFIKSLNEKYDKTSKFRDLDLKGINESFSSYSGEKFRSTFTESIKNLGSEYKKYFLDSESTDIYLLFIDICSFSTRFSNLNNKELSALLDIYYDLVIPIIYKYNGEIDKVIGDGIIAVFGAPFISENNLETKVNNCAKELIEKTKDTILYSKVAINSGDIMYYHNKSIHYEEFTIIGKPITELYRLESISTDKKINFFTESNYDNLLNQRISANQCPRKASWLVSESIAIIPPLKGVTRFKKRKTMEKI